MKVFHINSYYFVGKFYKNLYEEQIRAGMDIDVFVPANKKRQMKESYNHGDYTKISYVFDNIDRLFFFAKSKKIMNAIENEYELANYDLMHAHSLFANGYIAYKMHQKYGIPYVVAVRNTDVNLFFNKLIYLRNVGREILRNAEKIIFLSSSYRDFVINRYIKYDDKEKMQMKSIVIPNGIDKFWLNNINSDNKSIKDRNINIICAGTLDKNKNQLNTVKACRDLINKGYNVHFNVAGEIIEEKIYQKMISNDFVSYMGKLNKEQLLSAYRENDIFVMPSKTETFGLVYAEAMSQGLPLVYTRGQGFDGQFGEGIVGYNTDSDDYKEIAERIQKILGNYENISENCKINSNRFNWENIAAQYMAIYEKISKGENN